MLFIPPDIRVHDDELKFTFVRSSGPGGQNVNKVNSKAVMRLNIRSAAGVPPAVRERFIARFSTRISESGDLVLTSQRYRDQKRNEEDCREKLTAMLSAVARPPKRRRKTRPTRASVERKKEHKQETARKKRGRQWRDED
jgi:ribosome-associated protein